MWGGECLPRGRLVQVYCGLLMKCLHIGAPLAQRSGLLWFGSLLLLPSVCFASATSSGERGAL